MGNIVPYMEQFNANDLLIFARVADTGSFSRAAEQLDLPKSTLSRRISLLEERLGERLLLRSTRRLSLTAYGLQLLDHARQVAAEVDAVRALSEFRQARPSGRLCRGKVIRLFRCCVKRMRDSRPKPASCR